MFVLAGLRLMSYIRDVGTEGKYMFNCDGMSGHRWAELLEGVVMG